MQQRVVANPGRIDLLGDNRVQKVNLPNTNTQYFVIDSAERKAYEDLQAQLTNMR